MRLTLCALVLLPMAAHAQETTLPTPVEPVGQSQSCPVGTVWDGSAQSCAVAEGTASPVNSLSGKSGCSHGAAREVTS